jgi:hypothetical protein
MNMSIEIQGAGVTIKVIEACRGSASVDPPILTMTLGGDLIHSRR